MQDDFITFQTFSDTGIANEIADKLKQHKIDFKLEKATSFLDNGFVDTSLNSEIAIKIQSADFLKAHSALAEYYKRQIENIDTDYYLFDFTNSELTEILSKPDEWGYFDYQLATKILNERGVEITTETAQKLKENRSKELSKAEKASRLFLFFGYLFSILGGIIGIFIGHHLFHSRKTLPTGQRVFTYEKEDRKHGDRIFTIGIVILIFGLIMRFLGPLLGWD